MTVEGLIVPAADIFEPNTAGPKRFMLGIAEITANGCRRLSPFAAEPKELRPAGPFTFFYSNRLQGCVAGSELIQQCRASNSPT